MIDQLQLQDIVSKLPKIDTAGITEVMNVIEQSKKFQNPQNNILPDNTFELSYANYIATGNTEFLDLYLTVLTRACYTEFFEWYEYLTKHILNKDVQDAIGINLDPTHHDWESKFKSSELIGWAWQYPNIEVWLQNLDKVNAIGLMMLNYFNNDRRSHSFTSVIDEDYFESDHAQLVLDSISRILIGKDMQVLKDQLDCDGILCMIETYGWENRFNPVLLHWICNNKDRIKNWG